MKTTERMTLVLTGVEKIKAMVSNEHASKLDYDHFNNVLKNSFANDSIEGGNYLCAVIDIAKETFAYREELRSDGTKKQINPLKSIVTGLNRRFQGVYETKHRISTHKTKVTTITPPSAKSAPVSKVERAIMVLAGIGVNQLELEKMVADTLATIESEKAQALKAREEIEKELKASSLKALKDQAVTIAQHKGIELTKAGKVSKADQPLVDGIMAGLQANDSSWY